MRGRSSTSRYETGRNASTNGELFRATATLPALQLPLRHVLSDSGHWPMIDNPVAVEAPVTAFLHRFWPAGRIPRGDAVRRTALLQGVFKRPRR